ncbi:MAG: phosphotransferase [Nocardioides sp.]
MDHLTELTPLAGGYSGETFLGRVGADRVVVRVFGRALRSRLANAAGEATAADSAEVAAAVHRLVAGLVPVPAVLEVRRVDPVAGVPALLVTEFVSGERGDLVYPRLDDGGRRALGQALGGVLVRLAGMAMLGSVPFMGDPFMDAQLRIGSFGPEGLGLPEWVEAHMPRLGDLADDEVGALSSLAAAAQDVLDQTARTCLVHGDFNLKNLLIDPETLAVTGVVDWEYAHAGHPATDLGNLLRFTGPADAAFTDAVLDAFTAAFGGTRSQWRARGEAADLFALVDLAARSADEPANDIAARARVTLMRAVRRQLDPTRQTRLS